MDVFSLPKDTRPRGWYLALMAPNVKGPTFAWLDPSRLYCNSQVFHRANDSAVFNFHRLQSMYAGCVCIINTLVLCGGRRPLQTVPGISLLRSSMTPLTWWLESTQWDSSLVYQLLKIKQANSFKVVKWIVVKANHSWCIPNFISRGCYFALESGNLTPLAQTKFRLSAAPKALLPTITTFERPVTIVFAAPCQCGSPCGCALTGACAATALGKGFLAIRKAGHLCVATQDQPYSDYTGREKTMEVRLDVLKPGELAAFVFDWP